MKTLSPEEAPKPILKWVGSKRRLLPQLLPYFPRTFGEYHEPFFGGGSVFFALAPEAAWLGDACPDLMSCYTALRSDAEAVISHLRHNLRNEADHYYRLRESYNRGSGDQRQRAAWFLALNRLCFNGLWRVNRSGAMNVPFGDMKSPTICEDNLRAVSLVLQRADIACRHFTHPGKEPEAGDLWYADPPYIPASGTASFTAYTADGFTLADHAHLAVRFKELAASGVHCIASNSDTPLTRELYAGLELVEVKRAGTVSSKTAGRQTVGELLILGGSWERRGERKESGA